jgi:hypothetical protein
MRWAKRFGRSLLETHVGSSTTVVTACGANCYDGRFRKELRGLLGSDVF